MSSSSLSSSSSCLIKCQRIQYPDLRDSTSLRSIPSVERILSSRTFAPLAEEFGRARLKEAVVEHLDSLRLAREPFDEASAVARVRWSLPVSPASTLRRARKRICLSAHR